MDWLEVLETVGTSAVLVSSLCFLAKGLMNSLLSKDLEKFKSELSVKNAETIEKIKAELSAKNAEALEPFKAELQQATQKISVQFSSLHSKRLEVMAEVYEHIVTLSVLCLGLSFELVNRDHRKKAYATGEALKSEAQDIKEGIHTLIENEKSQLNELNNNCKKLLGFFLPKEIYFSNDLSFKIHQLATKAALLHTEYAKIAFEDATNSESHQDFYKNWGELSAGIMDLKEKIGAEFRELLGVADKVQP